MEAEVFLDAAYAIALSVPNDSHHERAVQLADAMEAAHTRLITTHPVLLEIGNALSKPRYREAAATLLHSLQADPAVAIVPLSEDLYSRALHLYRERTDKGWGLTDCVSFVVMRDLRISEALTTDAHFQQAGFRALLIEDSV